MPLQLTFESDFTFDNSGDFLDFGLAECSAIFGTDVGADGEVRGLLTRTSFSVRHLIKI